MSTLSISQMNWKKVSPPGLSLSLFDLMLTVLPEALRNATACRQLILNTQHGTLYMTFFDSCWAVNILMETSREMGGMRSAT